MEDFLIKLKQIGVFTFAMALWYFIFRWVLLGSTGDSAEDWLNNVTSLVIALYSLAFLGYNMYLTYYPRAKHPNLLLIRLYLLSTLCLWIWNLYCLGEMISLFIKEFTPINFGYLMLDVSILSYYTILVRFCYATYTNKIYTPITKI